MSRAVTNTDITTDTWSTMIDKVNQLLYALSTEIVTANSTTANTTGNVQIIGVLGANTIVVTGDLRGGNVGTAATLNVSSNVNFSGTSNLTLTNVTGNLVVSGALANVTSNVHVSGISNLAITNISGNLTVQANSTVTLINAQANSTTANVTVGGNTFTVTANVALTGANTSISTLTVTGHSNLEGVTSTGATGTGKLVFDTAPVLVNPVVGTQTALDNSTKAASTAYVDTAVASSSGTFTPIDSSGTALVIGGQGIYRKNGNQVTCWGSFTFPASSNTNGAVIGGFPYTSNSTSLQVGGYVGVGNFTGAQAAGGGGPYFFIINANANTMIIRSVAGTQLAVNDISTWHVNFSISYPI